MISTVAINNQSVTVSQTANTICSSSVVLNRVYWFRRRQVSTEPRPHKRSTKILGFGIFMIGVVILAISLIIGIEFPSYVSKKILKEQCILGKTHVHYDSWVRDSDYRRINRVYFWTIDNADDFASGISTPKFTERGPYVYTETQRKLNVIFKNQRLSYQTWISQTFNAALTESECGTKCLASENITLLNTELLQKMYYFGGWDNYVRSQLTKLVNTMLTNVVAHKTHDDIYKYLGCINYVCVNQTIANVSVPIPTLDLISFGNYVSQMDTKDKIIVVGSKQFITSDGYFKPLLIKSIYKHISTTINNQVFTSAIKQKCLNQSLRVNSEFYWSVFVKDITRIPTDFKALYENSATSGTVHMSRECSFSSAVLTLVTYLQNFVSWTSIVWTLSVCETGSSTDSCDEIKDSIESVLAFLNVAINFTNDDLLKQVNELFKPTPENSIVRTTSYKDLILGYKRTIDDTDPYDVQSVTGVLDHYKDFVDAYHKSPVITVSTCLDGDTTDNNMVIREYDGKTLSPTGVHRYHQQPIRGRISCFPPSETCRACVQSTPNSEEYEVFEVELQRSLKFSNQKDAEIQNEALYEFTLADGDLRDKTSCGLINVTSIRKFPAFVGNPYYLQSGCEHVERHTQLYRKDKISFIKEEPLTGRFWEQNTRLQTSTLILQEYIGQKAKSAFENISHVGQLLPVYWVDKTVELVQSEIDSFESKISHLMKVSCGGLIGLTLLSCLIMGLSVFVGLLSTRKNKVQPMVEDVIPASD